MAKKQAKQAKVPDGGGVDAAKAIDHHAIEMAWKRGEHGRAARLILDNGNAAMLQLIKTIPDDETLIRETVLVVKGKSNG
jgi:hypothetical protein